MTQGEISFAVPFSVPYFDAEKRCRNCKTETGVVCLIPSGSFPKVPRDNGHFNHMNVCRKCHRKLKKTLCLRDPFSEVDLSKAITGQDSLKRMGLELSPVTNPVRLHQFLMMEKWGIRFFFPTVIFPFLRHRIGTP